MTPARPPVGAERPVTRVLAEIAHILVPIDDVEERLKQALDLLGRIVPYDRSALVETTPDGALRVRFCPEPGADEATIEPALLRLLALVTELGTWLGTLGEATDGTGMDSWPSYLAVPLVGTDGVGGLLVVMRDAVDAYAEDDVRLVSIVAAQFAAYLTTWHLRDREARLAAERVGHLEAVRESAERLRVGLAHAPIVVFQQDRQLRYTWFDKLLPGWTAERIIGKHDGELFPSEVSGPLVAVKRRVLETGRGARDEVRAPGLNGTGFAHYDVIMEPLRDQSGAVVGITCAAVDVTQRKVTEELQHELMAMITHDLRTPLTAIRGQAETLQRRSVYDADAVTMILDQTGLLERLIGDLADISRVEMGQLDLRPRPADLVTIARESIVQAQARSSIHEIQLVAPAILPGTWDVDRVFQIFHNLLANAIAYSPDGGQIVVRLEARDDLAWVTIRDHGIGVAPQRLARLFDRFQRARRAGDGRPGGGLGLAIVRGLVEGHGGRVWIESDGPGTGATVTFTLPFHRETYRASQASRLTRRQLEVARLIAAGRSNAQIARELVLTPGTVANHIEQILRRLDAKNRAQVAAWIVERGLLHTDGRS